MNTEYVMDFLFDNRGQNLPSPGLAEVFEALTWCLSEECSAEISRVRRKWLEGDNRNKVEIALAMRQTLPCNNRSELASLLQRIVERWPELAQECKQTLDEWDETVRDPFGRLRQRGTGGTGGTVGTP
jgi:hypothetical protein